jgi:hypothetical protein
LDYSYNLPWRQLCAPPYREIDFGRWSLRRIELVPQMLYFQAGQVIAGQYTLLSDQTTWMSTALMEIESQTPHSAAAAGHVVVMGCGMGVVVYNLLSKPDVVRVTLVERDPEVIELLQRATDMDTWAGIEKLDIQVMDAFDCRPTERVDHLYVDIWPNLGSPQAVADTQQMQTYVCAGQVSWWGQEIAFLNWLNGRPPRLNLYRQWGDELDLPLIEQDHSAYMDCISQVAQGVFYRTVRYRDRGLIELI